MASAIRESAKGLRTVMVLSLDSSEPSAICRGYAFRHVVDFKKRLATRRQQSDDKFVIYERSAFFENGLHENPSH